MSGGVCPDAFSIKWVTGLAEEGVSVFCYWPAGRNAPLVRFSPCLDGRTPAG